ncbi:MAG: sortase domain-bontaining protein [Blastococcus sp.]
MLEGTAEKELSQGPGHYEGTALPGQPGNMGLAGHRVGKGSPFLDLDQLRPRDPIVVETVDSWFVYRNTASRTAIAVVLVLAVCALLLFVVFPWAEPHLPFSDVTGDS